MKKQRYSFADARRDCLHWMEMFGSAYARYEYGEANPADVEVESFEKDGQIGAKVRLLAKRRIDDKTLSSVMDAMVPDIVEKIPRKEFSQVEWYVIQPDPVKGDGFVCWRYTDKKAVA